MLITSYSVSGGIESRRDLRLTIAPDGSAEAEGAIVFPAGHDAGAVILETPAPAMARCACADADGNGRTGLTRIEFLARDPRRDELVPVTLAPLAEADIDRAGRYDIEVRVDGQPGVVTVLVIPGARRRKRRRAWRRRR